MSLVDSTLVLIISVLLSSSFTVAKPTPGIANEKIEVFKQKLLKSLGYTEPPIIRNISSSIQQQRAMIRKYKEHVKDKMSLEEERYPETINIYKPSDSLELSSDVDTASTKLFLNFKLIDKHPDDPHMETIISRAHLKLYLKEFNNSTAHVKIHSNEYFNILENEIIFSNIHANGRIVYLDITSLLTQWIENPQEQLGMAVSFSKNISDILQVSSRSLIGQSLHVNFVSEMEPVLEVFSYQKLIIGREKRQVDTTSRRDCVKGDGENRCCRFKTYISFADIGWDNWIIKPSGYEAYYCDGQCPHRFKMANTFAGIKSLLHIKHPSTYSSPCCVPSKLSPLTILHKDENGQFVFMDLDDMVVEDCKCA